MEIKVKETLLGYFHWWVSIFNLTERETKLFNEEKHETLNFYNELMMIMMNGFCGMVHRRKKFSLISSRDHCQRSSPSRISDTPRAGFEPAQNLSSGLVE